MTTQTGRTVSKWVAFKLDDSNGTLRTIAGVTTINGVGLTYDEGDVTALTDSIKNVLPNQPDLTITVGGKLDNTADTGFHTVFSGIAGGNTPLSMDIQFGIRHAWESGEPQFGITATATSGMLCTSYVVDPNGVDATAKLKVMGGTAPAWGTTAES
jgi:hypothetical protein